MPVKQLIRNKFNTYLQVYGQPDNANGWYNNSEAVLFVQWAVGYLMNNPIYNFNNLLWVDNIDFSYSEMNYIMANPTKVNFVNELMLQNDIDVDSKQRIVGLFIAFETAYANNTLNSLGQNPLYDYFWEKQKNIYLLQHIMELQKHLGLCIDSIGLLAKMQIKVK